MKMNLGELLVSGWLFAVSFLTIAHGASAGPTTEVSPLACYEFDSAVCLPYAVHYSIATERWCKKACERLVTIFPAFVVANSGKCSKVEKKIGYRCHCTMMVNSANQETVDVSTQSATAVDVLLSSTLEKSKLAQKKQQEAENELQLKEAENIAKLKEQAKKLEEKAAAEKAAAAQLLAEEQAKLETGKKELETGKKELQTGNEKLEQEKGKLEEEKKMHAEKMRKETEALEKEVEAHRQAQTKLEQQKADIDKQVKDLETRTAEDATRKKALDTARANFAMGLQEFLKETSNSATAYMTENKDK